MSETPESEQTPAESAQPTQPAATPPPCRSHNRLPPPAFPREASAPAVASKRGTARSIHYDLSYVVVNEASGRVARLCCWTICPVARLPGMACCPNSRRRTRRLRLRHARLWQSADPWPSDTSIWGHADALLYAFEGLKLREITLVGIGQGAAVAQVLANRLFREHVARLALLNSYAFETPLRPTGRCPTWSSIRIPKRRTMRTSKRYSTICARRRPTVQRDLRAP